jgi:hypothetical protein
MINNAQVNYTGLRKRPNFEEIVDYLANKQEKVKYPDREAKQIRNHPYLTQLDGVGMFEMQEQQENAWKEQEKERIVKQLDIKGKRDAGVQVQSVSNDDWDRMMSEAGGMIRETYEEMQRDRDKADSKFQTRAPIALQTGSRNVLDEAMERDMRFSLRSIRPSLSSASSSSKQAPPTPDVYLIEQISKGPPPPPGAAGAVAIPTGNYKKLASRALSMGYNAVYYAGAGGYYFFKFTRGVGSVTVPILLGLGQFLEGVDPMAGFQRSDEGYANESDDDNILEIEDESRSASAPVQAPKKVEPAPKVPFQLAKQTGPKVREVASKLGEGSRSKGNEAARNLARRALRTHTAITGA